MPLLLPTPTFLSLSLSEWDVETGKCLKTFKHKDPILATRINDTYIVSSCERGIIKVWHVVTAQLVKVREVGTGGNGTLVVMDWRRLMVYPPCSCQTTLEQLSYSYQKGSLEELKRKALPQKDIIYGLRIFKHL